MTDTLITVDEVRFPLTPWLTEGEFGERMQPIPGTWTLAPETLCAQGVKGIVCCPNAECREAALIRYDMGEVVNGVLHLHSFSCRKCGRLLHARLLEWDTRKLFCIAYELLLDDGVKPRKEYTHATSREEAFTFFTNGTGYHLTLNNQAWRMVDVAQAIGYFGHESDKDQIRLTV
jgi:hypothetical protein